MSALPAATPKEIQPWPRGRLRKLPSLQPASPHRPRFVGLIETLHSYLDAHPEVVENIVRALIDRAIGGDMRAMAMLWDRVDGPVR